MHNHTDKVNFIWSVADLIRDTFKRSKYQDVILPLTVLRRIDCVPHYDRTKASLLLKSFVDHHEQTIAKKVAIIIEHFAGQVAQRIEGRAKAMIVTRSRLQAVRYKRAVEHYLKERGYPYQALVAFSGTVKDGIDYTEASM